MIKLLNVRNYKRFNLHTFRQDMSSVPFDEIKNIARDASEMWTLWKAFFLDILNKHTPITNIEVRDFRDFIAFEYDQAKRLSQG